MINKMLKLASLALVAGFMTSSFDSVGMNERNTQKDVQNNQPSMSNEIEIVSFNNDGKKKLKGTALQIEFYMQYDEETTLKLKCNIDFDDPLKSVQNLFDEIRAKMPSTATTMVFLYGYYGWGTFHSVNGYKNFWSLGQAGDVYNHYARKMNLRTIKEAKFKGRQESALFLQMINS